MRTRSYSTSVATPARASHGRTDVEPKSARDRLGHADVCVTMNTYTHVLPEVRAEVAKKIEGVLL